MRRGRIEFPIGEATAARFKEEGFWNGDTLKSWLDRANAKYPDRVAVRSATAEWTYRQLRTKVQAFANGLASLGVSKGDVIAVQLQNVPEFIVVYLASGLCGAIVQTVHMPYRENELTQLLGHSGARVFVCHGAVKDYEAAALAVGLKERLPSLERIISVGESPDGAIAFADVCEMTSATASHVPQSTDPYVLLYTSGTAGSPKGVPSIYETYLGNARGTAPILGLSGDSTVVSAAPFTHLYGIFTLNVSLYVGATIALMPSFDAATFGNDVKSLKPTALFCGPAHLSLCQHAGTLTSECFGALDFVMISGAACPPELARRTQDVLRHGKVLQLWGMSEVQCGCITRLDDSLEIRFGTVGRAAPGATVRVAVDDEVIEDPGVDGELQIKGASIFVGYLDNDDATRNAFTSDGWFKTGDIAHIGADGSVTVTGRSKDIINRGGVKINPTDVEALVLEHPSVLACAIVPMPDAKLGERACLFVVPKGDAPELPHITHFLKDKGLAKLLWPERLELIDEMPLTPTKKVIKSKLVEYIRQKLATTTPANAR
ncbi:AMP-binding protein [Bradyrhizobium sp. 14AA]